VFKLHFQSIRGAGLNTILSYLFVKNCY